MNKEILYVIDSVSNEKGLPRDVIFRALEDALVAAAKRLYSENADIRIDLETDTGDYQVHRCWEVVSDDFEESEEDDRFFCNESMIKLSDALQKDSALEVGAFYRESVDNAQFGRIAAQAAKKAIIQKVREAERLKIISDYLPRIGELMSGTVKKVTRDAVIVDLGGNVDAVLTRSAMIPRENFRIRDRFRGLLVSVREELVSGPQLVLSRTAPQMLTALFQLEVPEIAENIISIHSAARDPGSRAKIAVHTNDGRIDPVGACVGMRGSRVQAVSGELAGERVDIVLWDKDPAQFVINAMSPAEILSIVVDEEKKAMDLVVAEDSLAQAIGRGGQNVRLASEVTGWSINVMTEEDSKEKQGAESAEIVSNFITALDVNEEMAEILLDEGFSTLEEVAYAPVEDLASIEQFDEDIAEELCSRAKDVLLTRAISQASAVQPDEDLVDLLEGEGVNKELAQDMAKQGIVTRDNLADLSIDDLRDLINIDREDARKLIVKARENWFD